jgi:hypothetical protein
MFILLLSTGLCASDNYQSEWIKGAPLEYKITYSANMANGTIRGRYLLDDKSEDCNDGPMELCESTAARSCPDVLIKPGDSRCGKVPNPDGVDGERAYPVPNLAHYLWYCRTETDISITQMLSILSVHVTMHADVIYFHSNCTPAGPNWAMVESLPEFCLCYREPVQCLYGERITKVAAIELQSDLDRLVLLQQYGGMYLDSDILVMKDVKSLRKYQCTLGLVQPQRAANSVILASKYSVFLSLWINTFLDHFSHIWAENSGALSCRLAKRYPHLVRLLWPVYEPKINELHKIYGDESTNGIKNKTYFVHLLRKGGHRDKITANMTTFFNSNSTFASIGKCIMLKAKQYVTPIYPEIDTYNISSICNINNV